MHIELFFLAAKDQQVETETLLEELLPNHQGLQNIILDLQREL